MHAHADNTTRPLEMNMSWVLLYMKFEPKTLDVATIMF